MRPRILTVRIKGTDLLGLSIEKVIEIDITDVNEAPYPPVLDKSIVPENGRAVLQPLLVDFSTADPERNKVALAMAEDDESLDNEFFYLKGTTLYSNAVFDYDQKPSMIIRVAATDTGGLVTITDYEIFVSNENEPPTLIMLSGNEVAENATSDTVLGVLTSEDPDEGDSFRYTLVEGTGDSDNGMFKILNSTNELATSGAANLDFETASNLSVRVASTDAGGNSYEQAFLIRVTNVNEPPLSIELDNSSVMERQNSGTLVGNLTSTDSDGTDTHTFALVSGSGDTNNNLFRITDGQLQTSKKLNVNTHPTASIRISSTDAGGLSFEQQLTITITDTPDAPTDIELDGNSIKKFERTGTFIGNFSATDSDEDDSHTFHLADKNGTDNDLFFYRRGETGIQPHVRRQFSSLLQNQRGGDG